MRIKEEMIEKIKGNFGLRKELIAVLGVTRTTLWNYLQDNDENLTKAAVLQKIAEHYNTTTEELLDTEIKAA